MDLRDKGGGAAGVVEMSALTVGAIVHRRHADASLRRFAMRHVSSANLRGTPREPGPCRG